MRKKKKRYDSSAKDISNTKPQCKLIIEQFEKATLWNTEIHQNLTIPFKNRTKTFLLCIKTFPKYLKVPKPISHMIIRFTASR